MSFSVQQRISGTSASIGHGGYLLHAGGGKVQADVLLTLKGDATSGTGINMTAPTSSIVVSGNTGVTIAAPAGNVVVTGTGMVIQPDVGGNTQIYGLRTTAMVFNSASPDKQLTKGHSGAFIKVTQDGTYSLILPTQFAIGTWYKFILGVSNSFTVLIDAGSAQIKGTFIQGKGALGSTGVTVVTNATKVGFASGAVVGDSIEIVSFDDMWYVNGISSKSDGAGLVQQA